MKGAKALVMFSGGLDSILATKLVRDQGISAEAVHFVGFFCSSKQDGSATSNAAKSLGIPLKIMSVGNGYLRMVRNPKHGYGKNMNPCIDCKIFMLKEAKKYAKKIGASFIVTGEVLDERPKSQHLGALNTIEKESHLKGRLLRPLSAKLLPETIVEKKGLIDRKKLMDIRGRSRKPQLELARNFGIKTYPSPAGGCLLTEKEFSIRLRDLLEHKKCCSLTDANLLRVGRHFRFGQNKVIVGRNEVENKILTSDKSKNDYLFELPVIAGPVTILQGLKSKKAIVVAAKLTAFYSDAKEKKITVNFGREKYDNAIPVMVPKRKYVDELRIS